MDERLVEAARVGDVRALHRIMAEDPDVLEKESLGHSADSVLHVAARRGKAVFVKEIVSLMPSLATATNQKGLIPLHMASAQGNVETVKELLKAGLDDEDDDQEMAMTTMNQCLVKEDEGWTPLHYAVFRGRVGVVKELIGHCSVCVEEVTAKRETVLHLAVKANQLKVVQVILERIKRLPNFQTLLEAKDINGKTVSDLAGAKKDFLVILAEKGKEKGKDEKKEETCVSVEVEDGIYRCYEEPDQNKEKKKVAASAEFENAVIVVATLIITLTYQGLANPPSTLFQTGTNIDWSCLSNSSFVLSSLFKSFPAIKLFKSCPAYLALWFLVINSIIFALSILPLLSSLHGPRLPLLLLRLLAVSLVMNYCVLLEAFTYYASYAAAPITYLSLAHFIYLIYKECRKKMKRSNKILSG